MVVSCNDPRAVVEIGFLSIISTAEVVNTPLPSIAAHFPFSILNASQMELPSALQHYLCSFIQYHCLIIEVFFSCLFKCSTNIIVEKQKHVYSLLIGLQVCNSFKNSFFFRSIECTLLDVSITNCSKRNLYILIKSSNLYTGVYA